MSGFQAFDPVEFLAEYQKSGGVVELGKVARIAHAAHPEIPLQYIRESLLREIVRMRGNALIETAREARKAQCSVSSMW